MAGASFPTHYQLRMENVPFSIVLETIAALLGGRGSVSDCLIDLCVCVYMNV